MIGGGVGHAVGCVAELYASALVERRDLGICTSGFKRVAELYASALVERKMVAEYLLASGGVAELYASALVERTTALSHTDGTERVSPSFMPRP